MCYYSIIRIRIFVMEFESCTTAPFVMCTYNLMLNRELSTTLHPWETITDNVGKHYGLVRLYIWEKVKSTYVIQYCPSKENVLCIGVGYSLLMWPMWVTDFSLSLVKVSDKLVHEKKKDLSPLWQWSQAEPRILLYLNRATKHNTQNIFKT